MGSNNNIPGTGPVINSAVAPGSMLLLSLALTSMFVFSNASPAGATEFSLSGRRLTLDLSWGMLFHYHGDNNTPKYLENQPKEDDNYLDMQNRLNAVLAAGPWSLGLRADIIFFHDLYENRAKGAFRYKNLFRPGTEINGDIQGASFLPEKLWGSYNTNNMEVTLGDFYATFGHGLVLAVRKVDELGVDTTLRGGKIKAFLGPVELQALAGTANPANLDPDKELILPDPDDVLAAARIAVNPSDGLKIGAHTVYCGMHYAGGLGGKLPRVDNLMAGLDVQALGLLNDKLDIFLDAAFQDRDPFDKLNVLDQASYNAGYGYGLYGGFNLNLHPFTFTLEFKNYDQLFLVDDKVKLLVDPVEYTYVDTNVFYYAPPTMERKDQEVPPQDNVLGGRAKIGIHLDAIDSDINVSYLLYAAGNKGKVGERRFPEDRRIYHLLLGFEKHWIKGHRLILTGGFREDYMYEPAGSKSLSDQLGHFEVDAKWAVYKKHGIGLFMKHEEEYKLGAGRFREGDFALEYTYGRIASAAFMLSYSGNPGFAPRKGETKLYFGGQITYRPSAIASLRLFGGSRRGGQRCVGGQCRIYPAFSGVELAATIRY
ncbi:MAG: hypothetical protein GXP49_04235 [Deltaproteobacteria bacterium]|nr:hypothetical protein [Deltaproteobacteria bacterium]